MISLRLINFVLIILLPVVQSCLDSGYKPPKDALFTRLKVKECGIEFRNDIQDDSSFNETTYRNFYNGGGVAIGDINNDGLADVFMTANQGPNKLFLNRGNFVFEDITEKAGINKQNGWSTGVTMADINGDGLLDIYVCVAGNIKGDRRRNELFINKGDLIFSEEAAKYNLQNEGGMSTQAAFFDYDMDGDLDVFIINNNCLKSIENFGVSLARNYVDSIGGDKLMRNDNGLFTDVSSKAGIYSGIIGFGLGLSIGDINQDKWPDVYISNDFFEKDYLYINQQDGTFRELSDSSISHMSNTSMGTDIADINNDGWADIFTTDMLPEDDYRLKKNTSFEDYEILHAKYKAGFHYQFASNMLHLNNGDNTFSEIGQFAGVDATDWSWSALVFDCDNDGWKDINVCNGMYLDVTDQDYIEFRANEMNRKMVIEKKAPTLYDQLKTMIPSVPLPNYQFINQGNLRFANKSAALGLAEPAFSNGAAYGDLDNDGDLDLVINNLNSECFVYRNNTSENLNRKYLKVGFIGEGKNKFGVGAEVFLYANGTIQMQQNFPTRGFQSCVDNVLTFGLDSVNYIDSILVIWPGFKKQVLKNVKSNKLLFVKESDANELYKKNKEKVSDWKYNEVSESHFNKEILFKENYFIDFNRERLMPHFLSTERHGMAIGDVNGDGLDDVFIGAAKHDTARLLLQSKTGSFVESTGMQGFKDDLLYEDAGAVFFDIDSDGDNDLLVASGGNLEQASSIYLNVRLYRNNGKGNFSRDKSGFPDIKVNASCVLLNDYDRDGDLDVFIGGRSVPALYGISPASYLLRNDNGRFVDVTSQIASGLQYVGMVSDAEWVDTDNDGKDELIVVGEWMPVTIFNYDVKTKQFKKNELVNSAGWWNCIETVDIDNDGDSDFVAGNLGLNSKIKSDTNRPAKIYLNDFDNNGTSECIITYFKNDGKEYPYYMKPDLVAQIPSLKKKILKHANYAGKSMEELFEKNTLKNCVVKEAVQMQTCLFVNDGHGNFSVKELPARAQFSPVYSILVEDVNKDNIPDLLLAGNLFGIKPELGRYDANYGTLLMGVGKSNFRYVPTTSSGIEARGEVRSLGTVKLASGEKLILMATNNDKLKAFRQK
jgi:hypothetical protein